MHSKQRIIRIFSSTVAILALAGPVVVADEIAGAAELQIAFKLDPRLVSGIYGGERWVSPPTYTGVTAQDTVEVRVLAVDRKGRPIRSTPEWTPSEPDMVSVSPNPGDHVKITVKRAGESKLQIAAQGISRELAIKAKYLNDSILVEIGQQAAAPSRGAASAAPDAPVFKSRKEKLSYAVGANLGSALRKQSVEVDSDLVVQGFKDALSGGKVLMTEQEMAAALADQESEVKSHQAAAHAVSRKELAGKNKQEGEAFFAGNKTKDGVVTLPSGLQYKILKAGEGPKPTAADQVVCNYRGTFLDGREFDSSYRRGRPATVSLTRVIKGWSEALPLMPAGSKWQLFVPSQLAYGERGSLRGKIEPNATLIFEVELLGIKGAGETDSSKASGEEGQADPGKPQPGTGAGQ